MAAGTDEATRWYRESVMRADFRDGTAAAAKLASVR